jgi:hypothetical protein
VIVVKTTNATILLLAVLVLAGVIVSPVSAITYTRTATPINGLMEHDHVFINNTVSTTFDASPNGKAILEAYFIVPSEAQVDFTLYYGSGGSVSGYMENHHESGIFGFAYTNSTVSINGVTKSYTYGDIVPLTELTITGYAYETGNNTVTGFLVSSYDYGGFLGNDLAAFYPVNVINNNLIYRIDATGTDSFNMEIVEASQSTVSNAVSRSALDAFNDWVNFSIGIASQLMGFVLMLFGIIKFFFIDNILLVIALWIGVTMAYSAISSKDIFGFYKKFFKFQRTLLDFIVGLWNTLVQIIAAFRGIFRI